MRRPQLTAQGPAERGFGPRPGVQAGGGGELALLRSRQAPSPSARQGDFTRGSHGRLADVRAWKHETYFLKSFWVSCHRLPCVTHRLPVSPCFLFGKHFVGDFFRLEVGLGKRNRGRNECERLESYGPEKLNRLVAFLFPAAYWMAKDSFAFGFVLDTFTCFGHFSYINNFILMLVGLR